MVCKRCGISKELDKLLPRTCFGEERNYIRHRWREERVCSCEHGETSHYYNKFGILQCRVGDCFPFRSGGHNISRS